MAFKLFSGSILTVSEAPGTLLKLFLMLVWPVTGGISMVGGTGVHLNPSITVRIYLRGL